jgi:hypothetical protein
VGRWEQEGRAAATRGKEMRRCAAASWGDEMTRDGRRRQQEEREQMRVRVGLDGVLLGRGGGRAVTGEGGTGGSARGQAEGRRRGGGRADAEKSTNGFFFR